MEDQEGERLLIFLGEYILIFFMSLALLYVLQATGKINLGLKVPGRLPPLKKSYRAILKQYFSYYLHLSSIDRKSFERKLVSFLHTKQFVGRGMQITDEVKVLISASAAQLTFGLPNVYLSHFSKVLVYPNDYYSTINNRYHKGEVNPRLKLIVLSWPSFVKGYIEHDSGRNLGLHEMAHALHLENRIPNEEFGFLDPAAFKSWREHAHKAMEEIRIGQNQLLRAYASTDVYEFFAVAVEYFFERPKELKHAMPQTYGLLVKLLNQDPIKLYNLGA
ncbi:MAG: zinc-dependent peptidase [Cyclobacteriaceae bacterium]